MNYIQNYKRLEQPEPEFGMQMKCLFQDLELDESELLQRHPKVMRKLKSQLNKLRQVFSEIDVGYTDKSKCEVKLNPCTTPIRQKARPTRDWRKIYTSS